MARLKKLLLLANQHITRFQKELAAKDELLAALNRDPFPVKAERAELEAALREQKQGEHGGKAGFSDARDAQT